MGAANSGVCQTKDALPPPAAKFGILPASVLRNESSVITAAQAVDVRKRRSFWTQMERLDSSFLALLKRVGSSFSRSAITALHSNKLKGF